jgi:hypothetical protein
MPEEKHGYDYRRNRRALGCEENEQQASRFQEQLSLFYKRHGENSSALHHRRDRSVRMASWKKQNRRKAKAQIF